MWCWGGRFQDSKFGVGVGIHSRALTKRTEAAYGLGIMGSGWEGATKDARVRVGGMGLRRTMRKTQAGP